MKTSDLEGFVSEVCGESHLRVEKDLGDGFVRLRSSEAERRQAAQDIRCSEDIVIEMLRNARDARARNIFVSVSREGSERSITMIDDGDGVPLHLQQAVFEPRVTSKLDSMHMDKWGVHGRGMALYSIAVNVTEARILTSGKGLGAAFSIKSDLSRLPEKTDQSTFPSFDLSDDGTVKVTGPKNILRTACEFSIESRKSCSVFLGSATEIAASLLQYGRALNVKPIADCTSEDIVSRTFDLPVCKRIAASSDPAALRSVAESLGLVMSERSARRVLDGTIKPLSPLLDQIKVHGLPATQGEKNPIEVSHARVLAKKRKLQISDDDKCAFLDKVMSAYSDLADAYYLQGDVTPALRVGKDALTITIPVANDD